MKPMRQTESAPYWSRAVIEWPETGPPNAS